MHQVSALALLNLGDRRVGDGRPGLGHGRQLLYARVTSASSSMIASEHCSASQLVLCLPRYQWCRKAGGWKTRAMCY